MCEIDSESNLFLHFENGYVFAYGVLKNKNTLQTVVKRQETIVKDNATKRDSYSILRVVEIELIYLGGLDNRYAVAQPQVAVVGKMIGQNKMSVLHIYNSPEGLWGEPIVMLENPDAGIPGFIFVSPSNKREDLENNERITKKVYLLESPRGTRYKYSGTDKRIKKFVIELDKYDEKAPAFFVMKNRHFSSDKNPFSDTYRIQEVDKDAVIIYIKATQVGCHF